MHSPTEEDAARPNPWALLGLSLLIAAAYLGLGRLGMLLAIPPGFATAVFPATGLALWALLRKGNAALPGILLGAFLLNYSVNGQVGAGTRTLWTSLLMALGTTLQALLGARLARRGDHDPLRLVLPGDLLRVLLLGGPVACLIGATVAVLVLRSAGTLAPGDLAYTWWTWWVGDAIGVCLTVPALQMILSPEPLWRRRRLTVGLPMTVFATGIVLLFVRVSAVESRTWRAGLLQRNERVVAEFRGALDSRLEVLSGLEGLFRSIPKVEYQQFSRFLDSYFSRHRDIRSLEWSPRVLAKDRPAFEKAMSQALGHPFHIRAFSPERLDWEELKAKPEYFPLSFTAPPDVAVRAEGMDLGSIAARIPNLESARDTGRPVLVAWRSLRQDQVRRPVMCVTFPIYRVPGARLTVQERREALLGYAVGIFYSDDLLNEALRQTHLQDTGTVFRAPLAGGGRFVAAQAGGERIAGAPVQIAPFEYLGCQLEIHTWPSAEFLHARRGWQLFLVLAAGLSFTAILGALLLLVSGRAAEAESLAERRGRALEHLGAQARLILLHAVEPILTLDETGRIEAANAACRRLFGWEHEGPLGRPVSEILPGLQALLRRTDSSGSMLELQGFHADGEPIPLEVGFNAVELEERVLFAVFLRDLRERRRVERLKREFLSVVSHELRTPLTSIRGSLGLLESGVAGALGDRAATLVRLAHENSVRLGRLVDDLLDMEKLERAELRLEIQETDLGALLLAALEAHQGFAAQLGVELKLRPWAEQGARVLADRGRLLQVLGNLLSNALKLSPRGSTVLLRAEGSGAFIRIEVRDQGPGVPDSFRHQIFEKFTQADGSEGRGVPGTGLGLAIAKALMERMKGTIGFRNEADGGATFFLDVPRVP